MRRNNMSRASQGVPASAGPLLTNHLHDLDLELQLLKRKREMVEQQQRLLNNFPSQQFQQRQFNQGGYNDNFSQQNFNQPRGNQPRSLLPNHNFANLYDEAPQPFRQSGNFNRQFGNKRPATDQIWQDNTPPKRFSAPQRAPQRPPMRRNDEPRRPPLIARTPRSNYQRSGPAPPRSNPNNQRFGNSDILKPNNRFNAPADTRPPRQKSGVANKIRKPTSTAPNKLKTYPTEQCKALVKEASHLAQPKDHVLLPDDTPSKQITGRMDFALGHIFKELKQQYSQTEEYKDHFINIPLHRAIKTLIRERLRSVMLGKPVGLFDEVVKVYRVKFPVNTDKGLLDLASEKVKEEGKLAIRFVDQVNPEKYFRFNLNRLMKTTLDEMVSRLEEIYVKNEEWKKDAEKVEKSFPKDEKSVNGDKDKLSEKATAVAEDNSVNTSAVDETISNKTGDIAEENKNNLNASEDPGVEKNDDSVTDLEKSKTIEYYDKMMTMLLKRRMPNLFHTYKDYILRLLNTSPVYKNTEAAIIMNTNLKAEKLAEERKLVQSGKKSQTQTPNKTNKKENVAKTPKNPVAEFSTMYFVKIFARPSLPKRPVMQEFLDKFKPKSIKRHKNVHNLLFVGFGNVEDYHNIQKEDNCVIGKSTLSIKPSDKNKDDTIKNALAKEETTTTAKVKDTIQETSQDDTADISISSELDDQITDLLSSISQADNEQNNDKNENNVADEGTNDNVSTNIEESNEDTNENVATNIEQSNEATDDNVAKNIEESNEATDDNVATNIKECNEARDVNLATNIEESNKATNNTEAIFTDKAPNTEKKINNAEIDGNGDAKIEEEAKNEVKELNNDAVEAVKETGRATPTRASTRLATSTPNTIKTRRASKLAQN